jgi:WD40 repeat protein
VDRVVRIWTVVGDSLVPEEPLTLSGHTAAVYRVVWSPDGHRLVTASRDGTSRLYVVDLNDLVDLARSKVTRGLTAEECQKFLHLERCPN